MDEVIICKLCQAENAAGSVFCGECGKKLENIISPPAFTSKIDDDIATKIVESVKENEKTAPAVIGNVNENRQKTAAFSGTIIKKEAATTAFDKAVETRATVSAFSGEAEGEKTPNTVFEEKKTTGATTEIYETHDPMAKITANWDMLPPTMPIRRRRTL